MRARLGQAGLVDEDLSALREAQTGQQVEQGALSAARGTQHRPGFALTDAPIKAVEDRRLLRIMEADLVELDHDLGGLHPYVLRPP